jgi:hypothetical protein
VKTCAVCGEAKPFADFYRAAGMKDGHRSECKACNLAARRAKYAENPRPYIDRVLKWQRANREQYLQRLRDYTGFLARDRWCDRGRHCHVGPTVANDEDRLSAAISYLARDDELTAVVRGRAVALRG